MHAVLKNLNLNLYVVSTPIYHSRRRGITF